MKMSAWDVVFPFDPYVDPQNFKMWVCVVPDLLWFLRINTRDHQPSVLLTVADHPFLTYDSYFALHGNLITETDAAFQDLLDRQQRPDRRGIVGCIAPRLRPEAAAGIMTSPYLSPMQCRLIGAAQG